MQTLYPTMAGSGKALHDRGFNPDYLPDGSSLLDVVRDLARYEPGGQGAGRGRGPGL